MATTVSPDRSQRRLRFGVDTLFLILALIYLLVPLGAMLAFGLSGDSLFSSFQKIFSDKDFYNTLLTSLELAVTATLLSLILITPTAYWVQIRLPKLRVLLEILSLIPFAVPAIVLSLGLLEVYGTPDTLTAIFSFGLVPLLSGPPFTIANTPPLLACAYVIISLPFVYRPIDNSLRALNATVLTEAGQSLGANWWNIFWHVILPNIWPGMISAALLTFSTAMGEYTLASLFGIYTFPNYLNQVGQMDPHEAASLSVFSFILTLICVLAIILLLRRRADAAGSEGGSEIVAIK
ncbi:MAG TPA: ABC transporter permease subunit [Ktedonobacteraceae bacterium]|jgi:putative spermidine/putrescine transport system permease protein|nr:ABC transporter permease subunit [Ktedonobacteraceae bacterium]